MNDPVTMMLLSASETLNNPGPDKTKAELVKQLADVRHALSLYKAESMAAWNFINGEGVYPQKLIQRTEYEDCVARTKEYEGREDD